MTHGSDVSVFVFCDSTSAMASFITSMFFLGVSPVSKKVSLSSTCSLSFSPNVVLGWSMGWGGEEGRRGREEGGINGSFDNNCRGHTYSRSTGQ